MFVTKKTLSFRIDQLDQQIKWLQKARDTSRCQIQELETKVKQLECPHDGEVDYDYYGGELPPSYEVTCKDCGKSLRVISHEDVKADKVARLQNRIDKLSNK